MKRLTIICAATLIAILGVVGCQSGTSTSTPVYSGLIISGELPSGWQETTITELERFSGTQLPIPK